MVVTLQPFLAKTTRFILNNRKKHIKNDLLSERNEDKNTIRRYKESRTLKQEKTNRNIDVLFTLANILVSHTNNKVLLCWFIVAYQNVKNKLRQIEELYFPLGDVEIFLKLFHKLGMPIIPLASQ